MPLLKEKVMAAYKVILGPIKVGDRIVSDNETVELDPKDGEKLKLLGVVEPTTITIASETRRKKEETENPSE